MKKRVLISGRAMDEIEARVGKIGAEAAGGLLIGYPTTDGYWVERILACRNAAGPNERDRRYTVDPAALANVRTTLERSHLSVLGIYLSRGAESERRLAPMEALRLVPTSNGHGRTPPRVWLDTAGASDIDLDVQVLPTRERAIAFCPE